MNSFLRFPTQHGDFFVKPETIKAIEDYGTTAMIYFEFNGQSRAVEVTCTAGEVMTAIEEWHRPMHEAAERILRQYRDT